MVVVSPSARTVMMMPEGDELSKELWRKLKWCVKFEDALNYSSPWLVQKIKSNSSIPQALRQTRFGQQKSTEHELR